MSSLRKVRRDWPILYIVYKLKRVYNNFYLQKLIYLAMVEEYIPIQYAFTKADYGPYDTTIKTDAIDLAKKEFLSVSFDRGWIFEITEQGIEYVKNLLKTIPQKYIHAIDRVLSKFGKYSLSELGSYVYAHHIREADENELIKKAVAKNVRETISNFKHFPPSHNSTLICGALDYCLLALNKEELTDPIQKDYLLRLIYSFTNEIKNIYDQVHRQADVLAELTLDNIEEAFQLVQNVCSGLKILPLIDEEFDLSLLT